MNLLDGIKGSAAVAAMWCGRPRGSGVCQRGRLQRIHAPSLAFGWVLKAADMKSVRPGSARCGFAQPILNFLGSVTTRMSGSEAGLRPATSISGGVQGLFAGAELKSASHCTRKIGNPRVEKVLQRRSQMLFV